MRRLPFGLEPFQMLAHLLAAFAHHGVEPFELDHLTRHGVEGEAVPVEHLGELGVRGDDGGAEGTDRSLLLEQRRRIQGAPFPGRLHAGADLEMDMPMRITRTARAVRHGNRLHLAGGHDLLLPARADASNGVLGNPSPNLRHGILFRQVEGIGDLRVECGGDRQRLGGVDDHLREPRRSPPPLTRQSRLSHRLARDRVHPVHPSGVGLRVEPESSGDVALTVEGRELRDRGVVPEVVIVST